LGLVLLLQHLPEPGLLLVLRENESGVHPDPEAGLVAAFLTLFPVLLGHVALPVLLANVHLAHSLENTILKCKKSCRYSIRSLFILFVWVKQSLMFYSK